MGTSRKIGAGDEPPFGCGGKQSLKIEPLPRDSAQDTPPKIDLRDAHAMRRELATVYREMRTGKIAPSDGTKLAHVLEIMRRFSETTDLQARLELVERQLQMRRS
jgi:hypothetical protein